jgi:hypothetical protein
MIRFVLAAFVLVACSSDPIAIPDPTTGASSSVGSGGMGGQGGMGGVGGDGGSGGDGGIPMPGDSSGSRLRRYVYTSPDGLRHSRDMLRDLLLQVDCYPVRTPVGMRCVPWDHHTAPAPGFASYYIDAACSAPAFLVPKSCPGSAYVVTSASSPQTCANPGEASAAFAVYPIGGQEYTEAYHVPPGGACAQVNPASLASSIVYAIGPEINYETLAPVSLGWE